MPAESTIYEDGPACLPCPAMPRRAWLNRRMIPPGIFCHRGIKYPATVFYSDIYTITKLQGGPSSNQWVDGGGEWEWAKYDATIDMDCNPRELYSFSCQLNDSRVSDFVEQNLSGNTLV